MSQSPIRSGAQTRMMRRLVPVAFSALLLGGVALFAHAGRPYQYGPGMMHPTEQQPMQNMEKQEKMEEKMEDDGGPKDDNSRPAKPPKAKGIVILFSGKQKEVSDNFVYAGSKKPAEWQVENGSMVTSKDSIISKQQFVDFQLHVEFKVPYMPDKHGQERGNSGVGLLGNYEIQVLDSYGFKEPGSGDCGAVYSQAGPLVNACKPPRQWQTYDIVFHAPIWDEGGKKVRNARVTVLQNGICVQDNQEVRGPTGISNVETKSGPIYLQFHNNTVRFRNVWVIPLPPAGPTHYEPR